MTPQHDANELVVAALLEQRAQVVKDLGRFTRHSRWFTWFVWFWMAWIIGWGLTELVMGRWGFVLMYAGLGAVHYGFTVRRNEETIRTGVRWRVAWISEIDERVTTLREG